jgi:hypothetical protein
MKPNDIIELEGHCWISVVPPENKGDPDGIMQIRRDELEKQLQKWGYRLDAKTN